MTEFDIFGARYVTDRNHKLAVVGLCRSVDLSACERKLPALRQLGFDSVDATEIDLTLANALCTLFNGSALAVGATVYIPEIANRVYRTGGVLGRPSEENEDAACELDELGKDLWMYTLSGGPGWIGCLAQEQAVKLASETVNEAVVYPAKVNEVYRKLMQLSPELYLFVSDGTGYDSFGLCAAKCGSKELCFLV